MLLPRPLRCRPGWYALDTRICAVGDRILENQVTPRVYADELHMAWFRRIEQRADPEVSVDVAIPVQLLLQVRREAALRAPSDAEDPPGAHDPDAFGRTPVP